MNRLIEAKLRTKSGNMVKIYQHSEGRTGVFMEPHESRIYDVSIEDMFYGFQKQGYEVIETARQVDEREFGNANGDGGKAYEITKFEDGKVVVDTVKIQAKAEVKA